MELRGGRKGRMRAGKDLTEWIGRLIINYEAGVAQR